MLITIVVAPNGDCVSVSLKLAGYDVSYENGRFFPLDNQPRLSIIPASLINSVYCPVREENMTQLLSYYIHSRRLPVCR